MVSSSDEDWNVERSVLSQDNRGRLNKPDTFAADTFSKKVKHKLLFNNFEDRNIKKVRVLDIKCVLYSSL